jgi:hypothetical protein
VKAVLLSLLRPLIHRCRKHMSWQMDGRNGVAGVGDSQRKGFALMRDQRRHRIAFRALPSQAYAPANQAYAPGGPERVLLGRFEIGDDDFEPGVA